MGEQVPLFFLKRRRRLLIQGRHQPSRWFIATVPEYARGKKFEIGSDSHHNSQVLKGLAGHKVIKRDIKCHAYDPGGASRGFKRQSTHRFPTTKPPPSRRGAMFQPNGKLKLCEYKKFTLLGSCEARLLAGKHQSISHKSKKPDSGWLIGTLGTPT